MNMKLTQNRTFRRMFVNILSMFVILAIAFPITTVSAANDSPFVGQWRGSDPDGSEIRLTLAGPADGPFQITWTESYIGFCDGEAGIVRGTGWLNEADPNLLEADLHLECFTTNATLDFHLTWRYHPATNTLSSRYDNGVVTIWHRPGGGQAEQPPALDLRVNYGHDWVESFYEGGHTAWVTVTDADGNVKATSELMTEPKDYWGGETGFQSLDSVWFDEYGNQMEYPPDILPNDWVYAWVDNGASAQVQIGDISGMIDLANDSISGTIYAPWFTDAVQVECLDWGSGQEPPFDNQDAGFRLTNGEDPYSCAWEEWDIQPYQNVGVAYSGTDGHWVANAFFARNPRIVASEAGDWFWMTEFNVGTLDLFLYESAEDGAALLWSGHTEVTDTWGITFVGYDIHGQDMLPGNYLVISDGMNSKGLVLETITVDVFDTENDLMAGTAPLGREVVAAAGPQEWQERITVTADPETGAWLADFKTIGFDITEDMRGWSSAAIYDEDGDANEGSTPPPPPNPRFVVFPEWEWFDGNDWPDGATVDITVLNKPECTTTKVSWDNFFNGSFGEGCDLVVGDVVTFTDGETTRTHTVRNLAVTAVDDAADTVSGTSDPYETVYVWQHEPGEQIPVQADEYGEWLADLSGVYDIHPGSSGRSEIRDEFGNATAVDWYVPNPHFSIFPEWDYIEAWEWPDGALVTATVSEKPQCDAQGTSGHPSWDPNALFVSFWLPDGCDVVVGDVVTLTDGVTTREYTVQNLTITAVDKDANTIIGTADPEVMVHVWPHGYNELLPTADADGNWIADFTETGPDLVEGMGGRTEVRDELGNATAVEWRILNPYIEAAPFSDWIHAREWPLGTLMTLQIDDPSNGLGDVDYFATATMEQAPWNPNDPNDIVADFRWPDEFAPGPGYVLTMSGNGQTKTLTISDLRMTSFDEATDTISGMGTRNAQIQVCANVPDRCITRWVIADADGNWTANYAVPGTGSDDPDTFDVQPGSNGWAADYEADSDRTWFDWWVPNPRMTVFPEWEWFDGNDWPDGATVDISVANKPECTTSRISWGYFFNGSFGEECDVVVGDTVTFTDGTTTRIHTIRNLAITNVDKVADTIMGTANEGEVVYAWVHGFGETNMQLTVEDGTWLADFGSSGFDIIEGMGGRSEIRDEFGNSTAVDWWIPSPRLIAFPAVDEIFGYNWPEGSEVYLTINTDEFTQTAIVGPSPWDPNDILAYFQFNGQYDLKPGDVVTLSGSDMERIYIVRNLSVTELNESASTVSGKADPGSEVMVYPFEFGNQPLRVTADGNGDWFANFAEAGIDLVPGMCGRSDIFDEFTDSTTVDWCIPTPTNPRIVVQITDDWFRAENFTPNGQLTFWVYDAPGGTLLRHPENTWQLDGSGGMTVGMWELEEYLDLVPGHYLVVSDGAFTRELVLEAFTFDVFDTTNGYLAGTAPEPFERPVWVGIGFQDNAWTMDVTTDLSGNWSADFGVPVPSDYQWVAAQIFDADGDATELRPASQIIFLRPRCGMTYTAQPNVPLEIRYGSWLALGEALAVQNAEHLTVDLVLDGVPVTGVQQPVVPGSEIPCGTSADAYGVFYVAQIGPLGPGTHTASVTWILDEQVTDGYDTDGDGVPDLYGPGVVSTYEFTIIVP